MELTNVDYTHVWVYGKREPGWYMAKWVWSEEYANHIRLLGYRVERSGPKPETN